MSAHAARRRRGAGNLPGGGHRHGSRTRGLRPTLLRSAARHAERAEEEVASRCRRLRGRRGSHQALVRAARARRRVSCARRPPVASRHPQRGSPRMRGKRSSRRATSSAAGSRTTPRDGTSSRSAIGASSTRRPRRRPSRTSPAAPRKARSPCSIPRATRSTTTRSSCARSSSGRGGASHPGATPHETSAPIDARRASRHRGGGVAVDTRGRHAVAPFTHPRRKPPAHRRATRHGAAAGVGATAESGPPVRRGHAAAFRDGSRGVRIRAIVPGERPARLDGAWVR